MAGKFVLLQDESGLVREHDEFDSEVKILCHDDRQRDTQQRKNVLDPSGSCKRD